MRWSLLALLALGCRAHVRPSAQVEALPVATLALDFPKPEEGRLTFTVDVPAASLRTVSRVTWELWVGSLRFATGIEGPTGGVPQSDGSLRVTVDAPLVYRHVTWVEGSAYLQVGLKAEVELSPPSVNALRFQTQRELLVRGKPVFDQGDE